MEKTYQRLDANRHTTWRRLIGSIMLSLAFSAFMAAKPTAAQGISLISDEETEQLLGKSPDRCLRQQKYALTAMTFILLTIRH